MARRALKQKAVWQTVVQTSAEAEEAVTELMHRIFEVPPSVYTNADTGEATVTVFSSKGKGWFQSRIQAVEAGLKFVAECGLKIGSGDIALRKVKREDWSESWKKYFKTIRVGKELLIKPSWSREKPGKGQVQVVLDPGLSFGTGQHPTTLYCLEELVRFRPIKTSHSFLDVGCGSGILAISAAKLGYSPVRAFDFDPVAVRIAKANARRNRVEKKVQVQRRDVTKPAAKFPKGYTLICANLVHDLLIDERNRIASLLAKVGRLVLAGILETQFAAVQKAYEQIGMQLVRNRSDREWKSGTFVFRE